MIGKAASSKSFSNTIKYVFEEIKQAKVVFGNFAEAVQKNADIDSIISQFDRLTKLNPKVKQPCYHLKFSPAVEDNLSDEDWSELSSELLKELDLKSNQAIAVLHRDTKYPNSEKIRVHLHLVVNKIDYQARSSSPKLYYDYYKIERFLREFEIKKNLTRVEFDYDRAMNQPTSDKENKIFLGDWLKGLDELGETAEELKTRERELNGIDLISYGLTSASSVAKLAIVLMSKAETIEDQKRLEEVVAVAKEIPLSEIADNNQKLLVAELQKKIAPSDIAEFSSQAQKLLKSRIDEIEKLPSKKKEESLVDSNPIFERAQKYLHTVNTMVQSLPDEYGIARGSNPQIEIVDTPQHKMISISVENREMYRAQTVKDGKWQEQINLLSDRQLNKLNRLPQNAEEVSREYAERKVASYLAQHLSANNQNQFLWKSKFKDGKQAVYPVALVSRSHQGIVIVVKNDSDSQVFKSEIANNGSVNVLENKIPKAHLEDFAEWMKKNQQINKNEAKPKKQSPAFRR